MTKADQRASQEILIEKNVPGGSGMGRCADGRVMFVPRAYAGDTVVVMSAREQRSAAFAERWELKQASVDRVTPDCKYALTCGGCDFMGLSSAAQAQQKLGLLQQALCRTAKINLDADAISWLPSPQKRGYRERIRLQIKDACLGFYAAFSHQVVEIDGCLVADDAILPVITLLAQCVKSSPALFAELGEVELRALPSFGQRAAEVLVHFLPPQSRPSRGRLRAKPKPPRGLGTTQKEELRKRLHPHRVSFFDDARLEQFPYELSPGVYGYAQAGVFSQVNAAINQQLIASVLALAKQNDIRTFLDLYCGSGNFSLPLLASGYTGQGGEMSPSAIALAKAAYADQRTAAWGDGEFFAEDCEKYAVRLAKDGRVFDLVIVDPPRAGAASVVQSLKTLCGKILVMVSCDPVTLARDLSHLVPLDFELLSVTACDMFPESHHVESFVVLRRR